MRGYDGDHRRLRLLCFERDGWRCVDCGWEPEIVALYRQHEPALPSTDRILAELTANYRQGERHLQADHQIPITDRPDLRLSLENLRTRCDECHRKKTRSPVRREGVGGS